MLNSFTSARARLWLARLAVLWLALWLRLTDLYRLPVFVDEGTHILWAQQFAQGQRDYPWLMDGRMLLGVALGQFAALSSAPLWVSRALIAVLAMLSVAACLAIGRALGSSAIGLLAGLLYAVLPFTLFHDRQAIADPPTAAFGALALALALRMARDGWRRWGYVVALGLALAAALLIKLTSAPYLAIPLLAPFLLPRTGEERKRSVIQNATAILVLLLVMGLFALAFFNRLGQSEGILTTQQLTFVECPPALCRLDFAEQLRRLPGVMGSLYVIIAPYVGWPLIILALGAGLMRASDARRGLSLVYLATLVSLLAVIVTATRPLPPRYYSFLPVPLAVGAAAGLLFAARWLARRFRWSRLGWGSALALVTLFPLMNSAAIVAVPARAGLPDLDVYQYFTGPYAGVGFPEAAQAMKPDSASALVLVDTFVYHSISAYLDPARFTAADAPTTDWETAARALSAGRTVYVVDRVEGADPRLAPDPDESLLLAYARPEPGAWLRLRRFADQRPESLREIFNALFIRPDGFLDDYDLLLAEIDSSQPTVLVPYPSHQAGFLRERLSAGASPQLFDTGGAQPWNLDATLAQLAPLPEQPGVIKVIFLQETRLDPQRRVETWLNTHLFRVSETWYGPLRVVEFAGGAPAAQTLPVNARFGDAITLRSLEIIDSNIKPGGNVRVRLNWEAGGPTAQPYKVFVHLFNAAGILAQHDGEPVGDLRPTTTWAAGERITDLVGVHVPADAAPGEYHLRIGLYNPDTQERLSAQLSNGSPAEFFEGGSVTVQ